MMNPLSSSSQQQQQQRPMRSRRRRTRTTSAAAAAAAAVFFSSAALLLHHHDHIYPMNYNNNVVLIVPAAAAAFQGTTTTRQRPSIAVHFRNNENNSAANNAFVLPTTTTATTTTTTTTPTAESLLHSNNNNHHRHYHHQHHQRAAPSLLPLLPAWLSIPRSHLAEANLAALQKAMMIPRGDNDDDDDSSFFTESESLQLMAAIQNACSSSGSSSTSSSDSSDNNNNSKKADRNMIAGAAEFCLLLVETAEMGLDALIAAAYHYVACVRARQERRVVVSSSSTSSSTTTSTKAWIPMHDDDGATVAASYGGEGVSRIVQDAARLKNLEMIAATVLDRDQQQQQQDDEAKRSSSNSRSRGSGVGVRPDYHDAENLRKLLLSETKDWRALAIRSAACLYRLRGILLHQHHQQQHQEQVRTVENIRTAREALLIYAPLASRLGMHRLKNELEGAAFRILYPRQFKLVNNLTHQHFAGHTDIGDSMKQVLEAVREDMTKMLQDDEEFSRLVENFSVTARVKEPYSLWKKMLRRGYKTILQVPDALALRIVLNSKKLDPNEDDEVTRARERALCYYAQNLCQQRYKPAADPRIKDYIDAPKENGYQSLHYTANTQWHGQEWTLEIQVRSGLMNSIAEFGLAAHFDYKLATSSQQQQQQQQHVADVKIRQNGHDLDNSSAAYLRNVQEWHWKQHGGTWAAHTASSASASSFPEPGFAIWQSRMRADRIRERNERLEPYIQALKTAQWDLARDYVFIFLSDEHSQVLALPAGACVLDALKTIKREEPNILLNGSATSVTRQLHNGDVLAF